MSDNAVTICTFDQGREGLPAGAEEILHIGRALASEMGAPLHWLVLGDLPDGASTTAGLYGVSALKQIEDPKLSPAQADAAVKAICDYCEENTPLALMLHQTLDARIVAPRVAGRLNKAVVMNGISVETAGENLQINASAYGGDTRVVYEVGPGPVLAFIANAAVPEPGEGAPVSAETLGCDLADVEERIEILEQASFDGPRLDDAEIIVSGGRGLGDSANYALIQQLAEAMGGLAGASRPLVDEGWVDSSHQVGLTGRITRPNLYLAVGISGASQHMAGCSAAKTLVAINRDEEAAIFQHARYGLVGDALEILPELIRVAQENKA
ncbi:MAG: electron transfer flavoprotein subunit alpha/FixB family protein [Myxococcota bacterium]|nr:electron transfer flavoprotein subunit alpha/FixB family protein [Myxococcota bacterium]